MKVKNAVGYDDHDLGAILVPTPLALLSAAHVGLYFAVQQADGAEADRYRQARQEIAALVRQAVHSEDYQYIKDLHKTGQRVDVTEMTEEDMRKLF